MDALTFVDTNRSLMEKDKCSKAIILVGLASESILALMAFILTLLHVGAQFSIYLSFAQLLLQIYQACVILPIFPIFAYIRIANNIYHDKRVAKQLWFVFIIILIMSGITMGSQYIPNLKYFLGDHQFAIQASNIISLIIIAITFIQLIDRSLLFLGLASSDILSIITLITKPKHLAIYYHLLGLGYGIFSIIIFISVLGKLRQIENS